MKQLFFEIRTIHNVLPLGMEQGEREAISLAVELGITTLITDDEKAFRNAVRQGLQPVRVVDLLVYAKQVGAITSVKAGLDAMKQQIGRIPPNAFASPTAGGALRSANRSANASYAGFKTSPGSW